MREYIDTVDARHGDKDMSALVPLPLVDGSMLAVSAEWKAGHSD